MKKTVLGLLIICLAAILIVWLMPSPQTQTPNYSLEFKKQAQATIAAIERLEQFAGALPEFEAKKAYDGLADLAQTPAEDNVQMILLNYMYAIKAAKLTEASKEMAQLSKARSDVSAIRSNLTAIIHSAPSRIF